MNYTGSSQYLILSFFCTLILVATMLVLIKNLSDGRWFSAYKVIVTIAITIGFGGGSLLLQSKTQYYLEKCDLARKLDERRATPVNLQKMEMGLYQVNDSWLENDGKCRANLTRITALYVNRQTKRVESVFTNWVGDIVNTGDTSIPSPRFHKTNQVPELFALITNDASGTKIIKEWHPLKD
jgi:hypothetical protein